MGYFIAAAFLWAFQRHFVFEPSRVMHASPADFPYAVEETSIGRVHGWWIPGTRADGKTVLYLHGNDGNVSTSIGETAPLQRLGLSVLLIDYRGFGASAGNFPSERSVYEDADAAWNYLVGERRLKPGNVYIYGHSLGGAIAIELARRHPEAAGLVVEASFTSIYDMARLEKQYSLFPVRLFLNQRFDSASKVPELRLPSLFIHGTSDETVPFDMGRALYARAGGEKRFVAVPGGRHETNALAGGDALLAELRGFFERDQRGLYSSSM